MPVLTKINTNVIADNAVTSAKIPADAIIASDIAADAVGSTEIAPNISLTGDYVGIPSATTTERDALTSVVGMLIYNSTIGMLQQYNASGWLSIAAPPIISSIAPTTADETGESIVITGSNFSTTVTVKIVGNDNTLYTPATVARNSSTQITITTPAGILVANEPYDIKVTNASGLAATLENVLDAGGVPTWTTAAGSLGTVIEDEVMTPITVVATDPDAASTIAYSFVTGSTPITGVALGSANGQLTGTPNVGGSLPVTHNFDLRATDESGNTVDRSFSIIRADVSGKNCLRFNGNVANTYLSRTPASAGNRRTWTWSGWIKRGNIRGWEVIFASGEASPENRTEISFESVDHLRFFQRNAGSNVIVLETTPEFRDTGAWYHLVVALDTTQATDTNRVKMYINNRQITTFKTSTYPAQNLDVHWNGTLPQLHGRRYAADGDFTGYLSDVWFTDGTAYTPSTFGEVDSTYGHWKAKNSPSVTIGTNGFHLTFGDSSDIGNDTGGNNNDFADSGFSTDDVMLGGIYDNVFCTLNPNHAPYNNETTQLWTEGNLDFHAGTTSGWRDTGGTLLLPTSGKWYWEACNVVGLTSIVLGLMEHGELAKTGAPLDTTGFSSGGWYNANGQDRKNGSNVNTWSSWGSALDTVSMAYDAATGELWFAKNGTWENSGNPAAGTGEVMTLDNAATKPMNICVGQASASASRGVCLNFGQDSSFAGARTAQNNADSGGIGDFYYTPPTGFKAICTKNLSNPTILDPADHFQTVLWDGSGSGQSITSLSFQPDLVWIKQRDGTEHHNVYDSLRGVTKRIRPNVSSAQDTRTSSLTAFLSNGFTVGGDGEVDQVSKDYVAWCWKAGTTANGTTGGAGTGKAYTRTANTTAGFSITKYIGNGSDGHEIPHGLTVAPDFVIIKNCSDGYSWIAQHSGVRAASQGDSYRGIFNDTSPFEDDAGSYWSNDLPTSTVVKLGTANHVNNNSTHDYIMYCWHSVDGFSKCGSFIGNGNVNGTFIYTGFKPAYVLIKNSTSAANWGIYDTVRDYPNKNDTAIWVNVADTEATVGTSYNIDLFSNGFSPNTVSSQVNHNANGFVYMAIAERSFKYARGL